MKTTLLTTLALAPLSLVAQDRVKPEKPNIIMILADDLGYGDVSCYNTESKVATPNLDRLARQGMRFTDAHSPSTVSTPSRYSLLTGRMAFRIPYKGVFAGVGGPCLIKEDQLTLPQMLREQGYTTAMTGKWHVGLSFFDTTGQRITKGGIEGVKMIDYSRAIPDAPVHRGFDRFFGTACCPATDFLYAFIDGDRIPVPPTGMLDKSNLPKHPYSQDNRDGMIAPDYDLEKLDQVFLQKSLQFLNEHVKDHPEKPFFLFHSMNAVHLPSFASKQFQGSTKAGPHGDFINELDYIIGELMKTLDRLGIADNTLVMFSSDNGPETTSVIHMRADYGHDGARPWRGVKRDQWEGGHRVPFIVRWPGKIASGSTSDQTICLTDIMATCAAMTGAALPGNAAEDSYNILPLMLGKAGDHAVRPYTLHQTTSLAMAIRKGPWKYLDHRGSGGNNYDNPGLKPFALPDLAPDAPGQLYNLETDPGEKVNLYFKHPEIVQELKALLESSKAQGDEAAAATLQPRIFDACAFGVKGDDATDNTEAFSRCLKAVVEAGGGRVILPDGVYRGRIIIPPVSSPSPSWITVEITGEHEPTPVFGTIGSFPLQSRGTILKCLAESGPSVITATPSDNSLYGGFSAVHVILKNLDVRTNDNPGIGGIDLKDAMQCKLENVFINTGVYNVRASKPTRQTSGLITPAVNNAAWTVLRNVTVTGYYNGIVVNEHTDGDNIVIGSNIHGLNFAQAHHASHFARVSSCRNVNTVTVSGAHGFSIEQLNIEQPGPDQTDAQNHWQTTESDVNDPGNLGVADINYWVVIGNVGARDVFLKKGGATIQSRRIGSTREGTAPRSETPAAGKKEQ